jgi:hypothetical protein
VAVGGPWHAGFAGVDGDAELVPEVEVGDEGFGAGGGF